MAGTSLSEAIGRAVAMERNAERFYTDLAEAATEVSAVPVFEEMVRHCRRHAELLLEVGGGPEIGLEADPGDLTTARALADGAGLEQALAIAIDSEYLLAAEYDSLAAESESIYLRDLFARLAEEEREHAREVIRLRDAGRWDPAKGDG